MYTKFLLVIALTASSLNMQAMNRWNSDEDDFPIFPRKTEAEIRNAEERERNQVTLNNWETALTNQIVRGLLSSRTQEQNKRIVTFLCCLKSKGHHDKRNSLYTRHIRSLFIAPLFEMMKKENQIRSLKEIFKLDDSTIKAQLLDTYCKPLGIEHKLESQKALALDPDVRCCATPGCAVAYKIQRRPIWQETFGIIFGKSIEAWALGTTGTCPKCGNSVKVVEFGN